MTRRRETIAPTYFEGLYTKDIDPWGFVTSTYEKEKYAQTLSSLPELRYARALEVGCSIGVFTSRLAAVCDHLLAVDASPTALREARARCKAWRQVEFREMFVPDDWPEDAFDLVVLSEVIYYLQAADVVRLAARVTGALAPKADVVLVHWTGATDYPLTGDEAADIFIAHMKGVTEIVETIRKPEYRLDVLKRR